MECKLMELKESSIPFLFFILAKKKGQSSGVQYDTNLQIIIIIIN